MATLNRNALFGRLQKTLRKHYKPTTPTNRPVLEQLLFACLLENAHEGPAEESFAALQEHFFDWNEVRVSTPAELAEVLTSLPEPLEAAHRLRNALQQVFESTYAFELESVRKLKLSQAQQKFERMKGITPFAVAYLTQVALAGHAIPLDRRTLEALAVVGLADAKELAAGSVTGLERTIPKSKGIEFSSLLHQLGADFAVNRYAPNLHEILLEINPAARDRLPKRPTKKQLAEAAAAAEAAKKRAEEERKAAEAKAAAKKPAPAAAKAMTAKANAKPAPTAAPKPSKDGKPAKAEPTAKPKPALVKTKPAADKPAAKKPAPAKKPPAGVTKKKPR